MGGRIIDQPLFSSFRLSRRSSASVISLCTNPTIIGSLRPFRKTMPSAMQESQRVGDVDRLRATEFSRISCRFPSAAPAAGAGGRDPGFNFGEGYAELAGFFVDEAFEVVAHAQTVEFGVGFVVPLLEPGE